MDEKLLLDKARQAMKNSYSPYSKFPVGAALLSKSGKIYKGCNIENASYGATNCAERTAIFNAVASGEKEFEAIAVVSNLDSYTYPCGICLQVILEHMPDGKLIFSNKQGEIKVLKISDLLPYAFTKDNLEDETF